MEYCDEESIVKQKMLNDEDGPGRTAIRKFAFVTNLSDSLRLVDERTKLAFYGRNNDIAPLSVDAISK